MKIETITSSARLPFIIAFVYVSFYTLIYLVLTNGGQTSMGDFGRIMSTVKLLLYAGLGGYGGWIATKKFNLDGVLASLAGIVGPVTTEIIFGVFFFFYYIYNFGMTILIQPRFFANYFGVMFAYYPWGVIIEIMIIAVICFFGGLTGVFLAKKSK